MRKKISPKLFKNKKRIWIIGGIGFLVILILGFNLFGGGGQDDKASESPTASKVTKGQLASSTLLTGMVKAQSEQYVYFDNTIGRNATVTVSVGEEVSVGQQLVQYDSTSAQAAYDTASRAYNKAVRDRNYFQPVSYTHLAWMYSCCFVFSTNVMGTIKDFQKKTTMPVSYTHLDVYKRQ